MESRNITKIVRNMNLYKNKVNKGKFELNETEYEMLRYITKREYRTCAEIASYLNVDKALVTRMSKKLENLDFITIETDPNDSRKKQLKATKKAFNIKFDIETEENTFYNAAMSELTNEEKEIFLNLVEKVYLKSKYLRKTGFKDVEKL